MQPSPALAAALLVLPAQGCASQDHRAERPLLATPDGPVLDMADILPAFRKGDLDGGAEAGVAALERVLAATTARGPDTTVSCREAMRKAA